MKYDTQKAERMAAKALACARRADSCLGVEDMRANLEKVKRYTEAALSHLDTFKGEG